MENDLISRANTLEDIEAKINHMKAEKDECFKNGDYSHGNVMVEKIITAEEIANIVKRQRME